MKAILIIYRQHNLHGTIPKTRSQTVCVQSSWLQHNQDLPMLSEEIWTACSHSGFQQSANRVFLWSRAAPRAPASICHQPPQMYAKTGCCTSILEHAKYSGDDTTCTAKNTLLPEHHGLLVAVEIAAHLMRCVEMQHLPVFNDWMCKSSNNTFHYLEYAYIYFAFTLFFTGL